MEILKSTKEGKNYTKLPLSSLLLHESGCFFLSTRRTKLAMVKRRTSQELNVNTMQIFRKNGIIAFGTYQHII